MKVWSIDRFEGNFAICETEEKEMVELLREKLPAQAKEGDVICNQAGRWILDLERTKKRRQRALKLQERLILKQKEEKNG